MTVKMTVSTQLLRSTTVFNTDNHINVSRAANNHIIMISEGSRYSEDWSNCANNSALRHWNKLHFKMYSNGVLYLFELCEITKLFGCIVFNCFIGCCFDRRTSVVMWIWFDSFAVSAFTRLKFSKCIHLPHIVDILSLWQWGNRGIIGWV